MQKCGASRATVYSSDRASTPQTWQCVVSPQLGIHRKLPLGEAYLLPFGGLRAPEEVRAGRQTGRQHLRPWEVWVLPNEISAESIDRARHAL